MKKVQYKFDNFRYTSGEINSLIVTSYISHKGFTPSDFLSKYIISPEEDLFQIATSIACLGIEDVIHYFEIAIPKGESTTNGAVYTPKVIRDRIIDYTFSTWLDKHDNVRELTCADISCGCGAFLYSLVLKIMDLTGCTYRQACKHVYGIDINPESIERTKILLALAAYEYGECFSESDCNLYTMNSLAIDDSMPKFDIVVGNPPYVRAKNIGAESKLLLKQWPVAKDGNPDLYIPFFEISLYCLKDDGILGLITPNTFLTSVNGRALRKHFSQNKLSITIDNFREEKVFEGKMVYTCITFVEKSKSDCILYQQVNLSNISSVRIEEYSNIEYSSLDDHRGWFLSDESVFTNIRKLKNTGKPLGESYKIRNGIATLANDIFIFRPTSEDEFFYYYDNHRIEKSICRNIIKPNKLKHESEISGLLEKVIFPYSADLDLIDEKEFSILYPNAYSYLGMHKTELLKRDKGECDYPWYAFGRTQAIEDKGKKLLFPYMAAKPHFVYTDDQDMMIYCGYAIYSDSEFELKVLKKILESGVFDYYMQKTSKPYSGGFYSYAKNYVKDFAICELIDEEKDYLYQEDDKNKIDEFLCLKYEINL